MPLCYPVFNFNLILVGTFWILDKTLLTHLVETLREALDKNRNVGVVMMDISKAFDCLPHGLLVKNWKGTTLTKIRANFCIATCKHRTPRVKIGDNRSNTGVLTKILNSFINDLFIQLSRYCVTGNYADDNTIFCIHKKWAHNVTTACNVTITWFCNNQMQAKPEYFNF